MRRIESMGLKPPLAWKDELYKNELTKLDVQKALNLYSTSKEGFEELECMQQKFFDRTVMNKNLGIMK
mgnify:CR=1 FL=1